MLRLLVKSGTYSKPELKVGVTNIYLIVLKYCYLFFFREKLRAVTFRQFFRNETVLSVLNNEQNLSVFHLFHPQHYYSRIQLVIVSKLQFETENPVLCIPLHSLIRKYYFD